MREHPFLHDFVFCVRTDRAYYYAVLLLLVDPGLDILLLLLLLLSSTTASSIRMLPIPTIL